MSDQLIIALFSWVISVSSYEMPHALPEVKYLQPDEFVEVVCGGTALCTALGMYRDGTGTVYLHESLRGKDNLGARSVVVHELVHYAQDLSARWREVSCDSWLAREKEAYRVQAAYVRSYGSGATLPQPLLTKAWCGKNPTPPPQSSS